MLKQLFLSQCRIEAVDKSGGARESICTCAVYAKIQQTSVFSTRVRMHWGDVRKQQQSRPSACRRHYLAIRPSTSPPPPAAAAVAVTELRGISAMSGQHRRSCCNLTMRAPSLLGWRSIGRDNHHATLSLVAIDGTLRSPLIQLIARILYIFIHHIWLHNREKLKNKIKIKQLN